jgi:hypothetical protein
MASTALIAKPTSAENRHTPCLTRTTSGRKTTALKGHKRVAGGWSEALPPDSPPRKTRRTPVGVPEDGETTVIGDHRTAFRQTAPRIAWVDLARIPPTRHINAVSNPDRGSGRMWNRFPGVPLLRNPRLPSETPSGTSCRDRGIFTRAMSDSTGVAGRMTAALSESSSPRLRPSRTVMTCRDQPVGEGAASDSIRRTGLDGPGA